MPLPLVGATLAGIILSSLAAFFVTKLPQILAAIGISAVVYSGLGVFTNSLINGVRHAVSGAGSISWGGHIVDAVGVLGSCGVFDALNIVLSGYVAVGTIKSGKVVWQSVTGGKS